MNNKYNVSASTLNSIKDCSMQYYLAKIMRLPEREWEKTHAGTITHSILEQLYKEKHRHVHDLIIKNDTIYASKSITRFLKIWQHKTKVSDSIISDIDGMVMTALKLSNFLDEGALTRLNPEHKFEILLSNGRKIKGFIDRAAKYKDKWIITDYKTASKKPTKEYISNAFQSSMYQLYIWKTYKETAEVRYYYLRHPPNKFAKQKHVMVTPPASEDQLNGFEKYLEHMGDVVNNFGLKEAYSNFCSDEGFCKNVCSFFRSFDYYAVKNKQDQKLVGNFTLDKIPDIDDDQYVEKYFFEGCPKWKGQ